MLKPITPGSEHMMVYLALMSLLHHQLVLPGSEHTMPGSEQYQIFKPGSERGSEQFCYPFHNSAALSPIDPQIGTLRVCAITLN